MSKDDDLMFWEGIIKAKLDASEKEDVVNKPNHYHKGGVDVLTFLEGKLTPMQWVAIHQFNIIKYVTRFYEKNGLEDLKKARFYLDKLIEMIEDPK